jgi:hypothetical protein
MPEGPAGAADPSLRSHWPAAVLAIVAGLVAIWAHHHLFPALSWNRDEPVYLWNGEVLRHGQLTATDGGHPDLFLPWLSATRDGFMFTQYTLGWPVVLLVARLLTGTAASALPVGAALAVIGTYALAFELTQRHRIAILAGSLLVASPILAVQGGVYLSYLFTLGIGLSAGALLLSGVRRHRPARHVAAGALLGWIFLTRPYDALLWGGAFGLGLLITETVRRRDVLRALVIAALSAVPFLLVALLYNRHVTGELLTFPITAADPLDGFGFGTRRLMPGFETVDYSLGKAVRASVKNAFLLPWFLVGGYLGSVVALAGLWLRRRDPLARYLLLVAAVFPVGYFVFWGTHLSSVASRISGPIYLVPLYAVIAILAAVAIDHWWSRRPAGAVAVLVVLAVATVPGAVTRFGVNREISEQQEAWRESVQDLPAGSLVFVDDTGRYLLFTNPFSSNGPGLDGDVLYATSGTPSMLDLIAERPERTPYLQEASVAAPELGPREDPHDLAVTLTPIEVERGEALVLSIAVSPLPGVDSIDVVVDTGVERRETTIDAADVSLPIRVVVGGGGHGSLIAGERGEITVTARYDTGGDAAPPPPVRRVTPYRLDGTVLKLVTPWVAQRYEEIEEDDFQWRHVAVLPELSIEVSAPTG